MEAKLYGQNKGGMSINGIIKDYYAYAGEKISAGDLVEYVNGVAGKTDYGESVDTAIDNINAYTGAVISAVKLDENRVFIAHSYGGDRYLYGIVVEINGATITMGTDTVLSTTSQAGYAISTTLLESGNVFIAYSPNYYLYGMIVLIDGTTITKGTETSLVSSSGAGKSISVVLLSNGNVFVAHSYNSSYLYLYGIVCTISGTTITKGSDTAISSTKNTGYQISPVLLPNGNVFIAHSYASDNYLYGIVCSISGTTITAGSDTALVTTSSSYAGQQISTCLLADGNVFIAHRYTSTMYLYGIVCSIDGTTITYGTDTAINSSVPHTDYGVSTVLLPNGNVFISHAQYIDTKHHLYGIICSVEGTKITVGADTPLNVSDNSTAWLTKSLLLPNGTIFTAHSYTENNFYLYAQIFGIDYDNNIPTNNISITEYETQVRKVTTGQFDGIAKTSGEGSPEYVEGEVEVTKTGNIFPTSGWNEEVTNTKYSTEDGYVIEASASIASNMTASNAFDNNTNTALGFTGMQGWLKITCPKPIKITKMKTYIQTNPYSIQIQGSNNDEVWLELATFKVSQSSLEEINLENFDTGNIDFYKYYKITVGATSQYVTSYIFEWQTSEYVEKEIGLIPNPNIGHKDIVSIWTKE